MTESESRRSNEQRRIADVVDSYEQAKASARSQTMMLVIVGCTFFGSILIWVSVSTAKDVIAPVNDRVTKIEVKVEQLLKMDEKIDKILDKVNGVK